ncbi:histidine kinase [Flavihumibacter sp. CACIAM 22H1]|uniref:sensor histidine kinase n=1 Tax=Flavihumibacter sp. CACIAM 22H1 TaxID=1812911 RepID=UPI0007A8F3E0|nr:histidine kinase [Flavihumibacter sp. CACIAM 22H1]KYP14330.1 MAG: hypothetical protein A1D16_08625 [Flavihumibacter sp. CACIAM 22H1]
MNTTIKKNLRIYGWISLSYLVLRWLVYIPSDPENFRAILFNEGWRVAYLSALNIFFYEYLFPFIKKSIATAIPAILFSIFLYSFGMFLWRLLGIELSIYTAFETGGNNTVSVGDQFGNGLAAFLYFSLFRHFYRYTQLKTRAKQMELEKQTAELNYLKSQTNPHFLFNTLNNIYALALNKSDLAPESILRLSKILRFMLYETSAPFISIEKEIRIIQDYIELEKLRYDESLEIRFSQRVEHASAHIPPLLLIPLVENAFKHGSAETISSPFVHIELITENDVLKMMVQNSIEPTDINSPIVENIGLSNIRRQLELLYTDYTLGCTKEKGVFTAQLKINLTSYVKPDLHYS